MINQYDLTKRVWQNPSYFIAFGFGSGLMPFAPGTWGTLAAFPIYLLLLHTHWLCYLLCTIFVFVLGVIVSNKVSEELGVHDYKGIVWDEILGYLVTMFLVPVGLIWMIVGFVLFRIFDIWKPQPIRMIDQKVPGGLGIMLDDLLAAVPAWIIIQVLAWSIA